MTYQHKELSQGRWKELSFLEQMANIGSEVERAINWKNKKDEEYSKTAFERALELIDLTLADEKNKKRLMEISRIREVLADYFFGKNQYSSSDKGWKDYFYAFGFAAAIKKGL
jgi:hypothetical protein